MTTRRITEAELVALESRAEFRVKEGTAKSQLLGRLTAMRDRRDEIEGAPVFADARAAGLVPDRAAPSTDQVTVAEQRVADAEQRLVVARRRVADMADGTSPVAAKYEDAALREALSAVSLAHAQIVVAEALLRSERKRLAAN